MIRLTFYGGVNEIGGNKILLEDKKTRLFLDFGVSFSFQAKYFTDYLHPRGINELGDQLEFGLLPRLRGLYSKDYLSNSGIPYTASQIDGVLLSHAHMDHVGAFHYLDQRIPVWLGETAFTILTALAESGGYDFGKHETRTFRTGHEFEIGSIRVEPIHVDHSIPGAYGFIIHTSEGAIVYSGDLRVHGPMEKMTREFVGKARESDPIATICEGTRIDPANLRAENSERDVFNKSMSVVKKSSGLIISSFYGRDIDRFNTFHTVAKETGRKFILSLKAAHLLSKLENDPKLAVPRLGDDVLVYAKRKRSGTYQDSDYFSWERRFLGKAVGYDFVKQNQNSLILNLDLPNFTELVDIRPSAGGDFIHSMSEPFSEEDIDAEVMRNWLNHFGLRFHQIHASGHASSHDLVTIINQIQPKTLIPVHTEHPKIFKSLVEERIEVRLPSRGVTMSI